MPMKGRFPVRRTLRYLSQGDVVFKDAVKVMTVNYNSRGERGEGARSVGGREPALAGVRPWDTSLFFPRSPFLRNQRPFPAPRSPGSARRRSGRSSSWPTRPTSGRASTACASACARWRARCPAPAWCRCPGT
uniref:Mitochondrial ribosomal protein S25 n=1 Tax=Propithecus coquereli TaxID=379532 RepID=A0A2K6G4W3_PROCO